MSLNTASNRNPGETLVLAITPQQDIASGIETRLRDAGRHVRVDWLDKSTDLEDYLLTRTPALFCCQASESGDENLAALLARCLEAAPTVPVVLIGGNDASPVELMNAGARDVVPTQDMEHLATVLIRELEVAGLRAGAERDRDRIEQLEHRLKAMLDESREARATIQEGIHARLNPTYAELFGFESTEELEGVPLMDLVSPPDRDRVKKELAACHKNRNDGEPIRFTGQRADDSPCDVLMHCHTIEIDGEQAIEILITDSRHATAPGYVETRSALHHALARPETERGEGIEGLCFVVIDDLYGLQERLGLARSDRVLDEVGLFLLETIDDDDQCFRFDTGEFVVICSRHSAKELQSLAETLRAAIDNEVFGDEEMSVSLTASVAVGAAAGDTDRGALLLQAARRARESAAGNGNAVLVENISDDRTDGDGEDRQWLELLQAGLEQDRFTFAYQSIASLEGNEEEHFDVILRLASEDGEILHPRQFMGSAHHHGLLPDIDRLVVHKILKLLAQRRKRGIGGMFFVQLSGATLDRAPDFLEWLRGHLAETRIEPKELRLSVTEDAMRGNVGHAQQLAEGLKELNLALTIEQFGTTGKSVQLLERIPVDFAKLDAAATEALAGEESDPRIVEAVEAARGRNVRLIAQQVADANTMARLWQVGISYVQGQFVQEPEIDGLDNSPSINVA